MGDVPGLVIPVAFPRPPGAGQPADPADPLAGAYLLVRLDWKTITGEILPALARQYFASPRWDDYTVAVREKGDPRRVLFLSDPKMKPASLGDGDLHLGMFNLRPFEELRSLSTERDAGGDHPHSPGGLRAHFGMGGPPPGRPPTTGGTWETGS